jgi:hypothetical protein
MQNLFSNNKIENEKQESLLGFLFTQIVIIGFGFYLLVFRLDDVTIFGESIYNEIYTEIMG